MNLAAAALAILLALASSASAATDDGTEGRALRKSSGVNRVATASRILKLFDDNAPGMAELDGGEGNESRGSNAGSEPGGINDLTGQLYNGDAEGTNSQMVGPPNFDDFDFVTQHEPEQEPDPPDLGCWWDHWYHWGGKGGG
mmetsp:Transcript_32514/g.68356  ORF Transcript_32514/g.68356 Transcript_32514/m.68356 type:complete len:142 (+) Transcript_32514:123-548(+)|eukprot:CAMPEP_0172306730 /NCGR_PEP_ID=MMETSP1058-20130122/7740_1 /TAXON_ID=83371 /ORGANISM="Detonula confervacea, Strain CCMP 353" /LENGTH=141 /DNA_ID=CAMNT_0013018707 /DNA_START=108 /DNA_END=533 /DNA_ORIENTATION=-